MPRAIDFHVHPPTREWLDGSMAPYVKGLEAHFRAEFPRKSFDEVADDYRALEVMAVLLAWDAETATGCPCVPNAVIAQACREHPDVFIGFGSVDPLKAARAVDALDEIATLGLLGVKLHPSMQAFAPDDERHWPIFERCEQLGLLCLVHTGTSAVGAGRPGGDGVRIDYSQPIRLDAPAAAFPELRIIAAHFGYPWHRELLAIARHKANVYVDTSGWAPRYIPSEVVEEISSPELQDRFLFGSDYPFVTPERCLRELEDFELPPPVMEKLLRGNANALLGIEA